MILFLMAVTVGEKPVGLADYQQVLILVSDPELPLGMNSAGLALKL